MPFCPNCGNESQASHQFCGVCGASLAEAGAGLVSAGPTEPGVPRALPYYNSAQRILFMSVLTHGLYLFYWFYLTWKQYRDHTGKEASPVGHALSLLVPIYGLFRTHAHMRTYKELMEGAGLATTINPSWAVGMVFISSVLDGVSFNLSGGLTSLPEVTQRMALGMAAVNFLSIAIITGLMLHVQGNLNAYWQSVTGGWTGQGAGLLTSVRVHPAEVILGVIGAFIWIDTLGSLFSASYRMYGTA